MMRALAQTRPAVLLWQPLLLFSLLLCGLTTASDGAAAWDSTAFEDAPAEGLVAATTTATAKSAPTAMNDFPSHITLRAGVLHAPPFATVQVAERDNGSPSSIEYGGFQYELLQRLKVFAASDNVTLEFELSPAPDQYESALNLVANDCQHYHPDNNETACDTLDMIVGDYYATPDRALRVDTSPAWLRSTISTIKYLNKKQMPQTPPPRKRSRMDLTTLKQALEAGATVCLTDGTFYAKAVQAKFPQMDFLMCSSQDACLEKLKAEECVLYVDDELQLRYRAAWDLDLEVTREQFMTQYIVWPMKLSLDPLVGQLMNRWIFAAITNGTLDELYFKYFQQKALCPVGTAGESCELPCDPKYGTSDAQGVCVCASTKWTGDDCSIEVLEDHNLIPLYMKILAFAMLALNGVVIVVCAIWLYWCRFSAQVRASQPFFLLLVLGCLISSSTIIAMAQENGEEDGEVYACMAIPWLYSVGFSVTFGTLFAKILRVYLIFTQAAQENTPRNYLSSGNYFSNSNKNLYSNTNHTTTTSQTRRNFVTFQETLIVIGVVLMIDVAILIVWTMVDPLHWQRSIILADQFGAPLSSQGYCTSDTWPIFSGIIGAFHLGLLSVACYLCYKARNIPTKFSEGKYVTIAMISNLQLLIVGVPVLIILGTDPQTSFFVRSVVVWMNDLAVVTLIFGNLMHSVYTTKPENNRASFVKREISEAISRYAPSTARSSGGLVRGNSALSLPALAQEKAHDPTSNNKEMCPIEDPSALFDASEPSLNDDDPSESFRISSKDRPANANNGKSDDANSRHIGNKTDVQEQRQKPRKNASISSLTIGSATFHSQQSKSVSWGMAYYSEVGDDEERSMPIALPLSTNDIFDQSDQSDHSNHHGNESHIESDVSGPPDNCTRFNSSHHPIQGAPLKPNKRPSKEFEDPMPMLHRYQQGPTKPKRKSSDFEDDTSLPKSHNMIAKPSRGTSLVCDSLGSIDNSFVDDFSEHDDSEFESAMTLTTTATDGDQCEASVTDIESQQPYLSSATDIGYQSHQLHIYPYATQEGREPCQPLTRPSTDQPPVRPRLQHIGSSRRCAIVRHSGVSISPFAEQAQGAPQRPPRRPSVPKNGDMDNEDDEEVLGKLTASQTDQGNIESAQVRT